MIFSVLLAGGTGTRMKTAKLPKQFLELGGVPMLRLTVDKFLCCSLIDQIIIAAPSIWISHTKDILSGSKYKHIAICEGGNTRQESLYKAISYITKSFPISKKDVIVSHDVARPFVTLRIIEENINLLKEYDAVDTVIPSTDTIVVSDNKKIISSIPTRDNMFQGQTPQTFYREDYLNIYEKSDKEYLTKLSDAARLFVDKGYKVGLVNGDIENIKITNEYDMNFAAFLLEKKC